MVLGFQPKLARRRIVSPFDPLANNTVAIEKDKESGSTTLILRVSTRTWSPFCTSGSIDWPSTSIALRSRGWARSSRRSASSKYFGGPRTSSSIY
jgi:hypothetical protein